MKGFLVFLLMLGAVLGGVYYYNPELLDIDAYLNEKPRKVKVKKAVRKPSGENSRKATPAPETGAASSAAEETPQPEPVAEEDSPQQEPVEVDTPQSGVEPDVESEAAERAQKPLSVLDNMEARAKAKAENKPALILWYGSDWMPHSGKLVNQWNKLKKKRLPVVIGQINETVGQKLDIYQREKLLPVGAFMNLPVAVLLAPDETLLGIYTGKTVMNAASMEKALESTLKTMPAYMSHVEKARSSEGIEAATAAAMALAMQPLETARRNKPMQNLIKKNDPTDSTLFRFLFGMDHMGMFAEIDAVLNGGKGADARFKGAERQFDAAITFVESVMKVAKIGPELKQQWLAGLAYVYREKFKATQEPALRQKMVQLYRQLVALDPESEYGKGALRWADYWDENHAYVFETPYYDNGDMTVGVDKEWRVNVSKSVNGAGTYSFTIVPYQNGRMTTKGFSLYANGKHVCDADTPADQDTKEVTFRIPRALKGRVEVRFRAQCFDGWFGCSGEMKMKKI